MEPVSITCFHHEGSPGTGFRNSGAGGRHTSELCGRTVLQAFRERSKSSLASSRVSNTSRGEEIVPQPKPLVEEARLVGERWRSVKAGLGLRRHFCRLPGRTTHAQHSTALAGKSAR